MLRLARDAGTAVVLSVSVAMCLSFEVVKAQTILCSNLAMDNRNTETLAVYRLTPYVRLVRSISLLDCGKMALIYNPLSQNCSHMPTIPKFHEVFIPMLTVLSADGELRREELKRRIRDEFYADLPEELLSQRTSTGHVLIMNRMGWAVSYLKKGKFVAQPKRGYVQITDKGRAALATKKLSLKDLKNDPDYLAADLEKHSDRDTKDSLIPTVDETPQDLIDQGFATIRDGLMADLLERLKTIDPFYFEKVILILLKKMGYGDFVETKKTGDGGIDGIINQDQLGIEKIYIQAKRYSENKVREKDIRNFIGAMSGDTTKGVFVTTSLFDEAAVKKAKEAHHKIILIDGYKLTDLMFQFGVGVQTTSVYELKELDEDFFDNS